MTAYEVINLVDDHTVIGISFKDDLNLPIGLGIDERKKKEWLKESSVLLKCLKVNGITMFDKKLYLYVNEINRREEGKVMGNTKLIIPYIAEFFKSFLKISQIIVRK